MEAFNEPAKQAEDSSPGRKPGDRVTKNDFSPRSGRQTLKPLSPAPRAQMFLASLTQGSASLHPGLYSSACFRRLVEPGRLSIYDSQIMELPASFRVPKNH